MNDPEDKGAKRFRQLMSGDPPIVPYPRDPQDPARRDRPFTSEDSSKDGRELDRKTMQGKLLGYQAELEKDPPVHRWHVSLVADLRAGKDVKHEAAIAIENLENILFRADSLIADLPAELGEIEPLRARVAELELELEETLEHERGTGELEP